MGVIAPSPMIAPSLVYKVWMVNFITTMLKLQSISNRIYKNKIISTIENDNKKMFSNGFFKSQKRRKKIANK